ncbi:MAG: signal recognition particle protein, partial [Asticcacaulis sp. 32-58-5]
KAEQMAKKLSKGQFDLNDLADQLTQMQKMGGMQGIMGLLPGVQKIKKQINDLDMSDKMFARQVAIISSMTKLERKKPDILNASRKRRVAAGAGVEVSEINRLLKQHRQMADAFKMMSRNTGGRGGMGAMAKMLGMGGGMPNMAQMQQMGKALKADPNMAIGDNAALDMERLKQLGAGKLPNLPSGGLPGLPGLGGGGLPGLGGGNPFDPKKK